MITRIEIENFKSIVRGGKAVISEGINFIHGPMARARQASSRQWL